jgi:aquaporin Z
MQLPILPLKQAGTRPALVHELRSPTAVLVVRGRPRVDLGALVRSFAAEAFGTFVLVLFGTGAIVIDRVTGGAVTHVGVSITFGLVVMALVYALGAASGAHLNPAVTLAFWAARRFPARRVVPYLVSQCVGAIAASLTVRFLFPQSPTLGETLPQADVMRVALLEALLTNVLMFVILSVSTGSKEKGLMAGAAIGAVVGLEALFAGPITGASMNPARSLGPALVSGNLASLWIYVVAPITGALLAVGVCRCVQKPGCCTAADMNCAA